MNTAKPVRLCLSGSALCTGLSPCEACRTALAQYVVPSALLKAGVDDEGRVLAFFDGYNDARKMLLGEIAKAAAAQRPEPAVATDPLSRPTVPSEPKTPGVNASPPGVDAEGVQKPSRRASLRPRPVAPRKAPSKTVAASAASSSPPEPETSSARNGVDATESFSSSTPETSTGESS